MTPVLLTLHSFSVYSPLISTSCQHRLLLNGKQKFSPFLQSRLILSSNTKLTDQDRSNFKEVFIVKAVLHFFHEEIYNVYLLIFVFSVNLYSTDNTDSKYRRLKSIKELSRILDTELLQSLSILDFYCLNSKPVIQSQKQKVLLNPQQRPFKNIENPQKPGWVPRCFAVITRHGSLSYRYY